MRRIKIFTAGCYTSLELQVNNWLKEFYGDVIEIRYSDSGAVSCLIFYREN